MLWYYAQVSNGDYRQTNNESPYEQNILPSYWYKTNKKRNSNRVLRLADETLTVSRTYDVERSLLFIQFSERQKEQRASDPRHDRKRTEQPCEFLLDVDRDERKVERGRDGVLELGEGSDEALHLLRGFGERVLERCDGGEDLGDTDEDVWAADDPDVERSGEWVPVSRLASTRLVVVARRALVDELLENGSVQHGKTGNKETGVDTLDWRVVDSHFAEAGIDKLIEDGNEDDERDRIQVLDEIVRSSVQCHAGGNSSEISVDLRVSKPEEGKPQENFASVKGTHGLSDKCVVPGDICRYRSR